MVEAALLGTEGDPSPELRPHQRAFSAGGNIFSSGDGRVFGWVVVGEHGARMPLAVFAFLLHLVLLPVPQKRV